MVSVTQNDCVISPKVHSRAKSSCELQWFMVLTNMQVTGVCSNREKTRTGIVIKLNGLLMNLICL